MNGFSRRALACGASAAVLMSQGTALAADADEIITLEEIIVSAQRRDQSLQDVPVTVTTFSAQEIQEARIQEVQDIVTRTPGLNFDAFPSGQPRLTIRGVRSDDRGAAGDAGAGVFLDEVYLGRPTMIAFDAYDVSRIEVLKGPQGTLFGRNIVGGAINVVTTPPDLDTVDGSLEGTVGNYGRLDGAGFINVPVKEGQTAIRASGSYRSHEGYVDNVTTGGELDDQETLSGRIQLLTKPTETLTLSLTADGTRDRSNGPGQHVVGIDESDPLSFFWTVDPDRDISRSEYDGQQDRDTWGVRGQVIWDLPGVTLNYIGAHRDADYIVSFDFDGSPRDAARNISIGGGNVEDSRMTSHELRFMSPSDSKITWVAGLYAYNMKTRRDDQLDLAVPDFDGNFDFSDGGTEGLLLTEIYHQDAKVRSRAAFADFTVPVTSELNLTAGVRYTKDKKTYSVDNLDSDATFRANEDIDVTVKGDWGAWTWRFGADYHFSDDHMVYAMVSRGFKSGGFQETPENVADAMDPLRPEYGTQYEIGTRSTFADGRLTWNNTLYRLEYKDLGVRETAGINIFSANADATVKGYETQLRWSVGSGLDLSGSYAYTDATFDDYVLPSVNYTGNRMSRTPKHKLVLSPSYSYGFASGADLSLAVDYQYESFIWDDNSNQGNEFREPTHFVDARLIYTSADDDWSVSLWAKNLTGEITRTHQATFLGGTFAPYNPPATYGVTLRWNY